jgi:hypothetical protein
MAGKNGLTRADRDAAGAFALLNALSIAVESAPSGSKAKRLDDIKRIQDSLNEAGEQFAGHSLFRVSRIEAVSIVAGGISIAMAYILFVLLISMDIGWGDALRYAPGTTIVIVIGLALGAVFLGFQAWFFGRGLWGRPLDLVGPRIKVLRDTLRVEKQKVYQELATHPDVRRQVFGDASTENSIGVKRSPGGGDGLAFHVVDRDGDIGEIPLEVKIDGLTIAVVVDGGADAPELL